MCLSVIEYARLPVVRHNGVPIFFKLLQLDGVTRVVALLLSRISGAGRMVSASSYFAFELGLSAGTALSIWTIWRYLARW